MYARKWNLEMKLLFFLASCLPAVCVWCVLPSQTDRMAIVLLPPGLSCAPSGHLFIAKQAGDPNMLYLKVFFHRRFREGTGWAEWGCVCMRLLGLSLCCLLQAGGTGVEGPWSGIWAIRPVRAEKYWVWNMALLFKIINCCTFVFQNCFKSRI